MTEISVNYRDFPNICRICLHTANGLHNLIELKMTELFKSLTNIEVRENDVFPKNVCRTCKNHLDDINVFIEKCSNSDAFLKKMYVRETENDVYDSDNCSVEENEEALKKTGVEEDDNLISKGMKSKVKRRSSKGAKANGRDCACCGEHLSPGGIRNHYKLNPNCKLDGCKCPICEKLFYPRNKLITHMRSHKKDTPYECPECSKKFAFAENLRRHALTHSGVKPFICKICEKGFLRKRSLEEHMNFHTGETPYICAYCGKGFKRLVDHAAHIYKIHSGNVDKVPKHQRKYTEKRVHLKLECNICGKIFASRSGYANHQLIHTGVKRFLCNMCGRKFITNATLQMHIRSHTGEKPFECKDCGKFFRQKSLLNSHMTRKPLNCPHCDKKYFTKSGLNNHMVTHSKDKLVKCPANHIPRDAGGKPHGCHLCSKYFMFPSHLNDHLRTHSGEKLYTCNICGKQLAHPQTLKVHMRQHTGETPFVCTVCDKGFYDSSNLRRHVKRHHNSENNTVKSEATK